MKDEQKIAKILQAYMPRAGSRRAFMQPEPEHKPSNGCGTLFLILVALAMCVILAGGLRGEKYATPTHSLCKHTWYGTVCY
jgi:hypothetical protein